MTSPTFCARETARRWHRADWRSSTSSSVREDAETRIFNTKKLLIPGEAGEPRYLLTLSEDITQRKHAEAQIAFLAHNDPLTHLPNRAAFTEHLTAAVERARSNGENFAVLCVDLDRFKEVNDIFGHPVGDALLRAAAKRLQAAAEGAFLARIGGDEFTLISHRQIATAEALADRLHAAFAADFDLDGQQLRIGLSIGIAIYPTDGADETTLIADADAALYRAKAEGRGKTSFFDIEMDTRLHERRALQLELRSALSRSEFSLVYQPQSQMNGEMVGMEALGAVEESHPRDRFAGSVHSARRGERPHHPDRRMDLARGVPRSRLLAATAGHRGQYFADPVSPWRPARAGARRCCMETGLAASRLELEITEGVLVEDFSRAVAILGRLKALGVRIAMDDFGTGYSSLSYLQAFPFDKIKIDQSFISNVGTNPQSAAIVRAVIGLARGLQLPVLAEGVETEDQLAFLSKEACDEVQGYFVGRPFPIDHYAEMIGREARDQRPARAIG